MLSRIAESLYWIGRYVERAEDTSRLLDVHLSLLLDDPWAPEDVVCASLLSAMGHENVEVAAAPKCSTSWPGTATAPRRWSGALYAARENARRSREVVSTELWETINVTWHEASRPARQASPHSFLAWVRERTAAVQRHRRQHVLARRGVALPGARPQPRAGRHDRAAGCLRGR